MGERPPPATLRWLEAVTGGRVARVQALAGATTSDVHAVRLVAPDGERRTVVLRRYAVPRVLEEDPGIVRREAEVLALLDGSELPAPRLLAVDEEGRDADVPAVAMSHLAGRVEWAPSDLDGWLTRLVDLMALVHAHPVAVAQVQPFRPYAPASWDPPPWLRDRGAWDAAVALAREPRPESATDVFLHRDLHPGNVLWRRGEVSGLVDWPSASIGPPSVDVVHCRTNVLVQLGVDAAERLEAVWRERTGLGIDPWIEVVMLVDAMWWTERFPRPPAVLRHMEGLLGRALSSLGG
ncbi:phosphotransferase family protein [Actinomarinicola tropica]|uniref:Phosphotransferase n=1 Tax=Actinomarinicola tropica TaxID=2789776 RepID=A0A5Q2RJQ0_9ACTN|nr:aminoglycoside phosphotransferase family protein [Actinomarinicola tropica]QGG94267.1 phosphotransferase [Actinomarinicola tropica]